MSAILRPIANAHHRARSVRVATTTSRTFNQNMGFVAPFMNNAG
jgi:hypothetical protein